MAKKIKKAKKKVKKAEQLKKKPKSGRMSSRFPFLAGEQHPGTFQRQVDMTQNIFRCRHGMNVGLFQVVLNSFIHPCKQRADIALVEVPYDFLESVNPCGVNEGHTSQADDEDLWLLIDIPDRILELLCRTKEKRPPNLVQCNAFRNRCEFLFE